MTTPKRPEGNEEEKVSAPLPVAKPDLKTAAAELARRLDDVRKAVAGIDRAKVVSHRVLDREVSI